MSATSPQCCTAVAALWQLSGQVARATCKKSFCGHLSEQCLLVQLQPTDAASCSKTRKEHLLYICDPNNNSAFSVHEHQSTQPCCYYWCCMQMVHSYVPSLYVNVHRVSTCFMAHLWAAKRIFKFAPKCVAILWSSSGTSESCSTPAGGWETWYWSPVDPLKAAL